MVKHPKKEKAKKEIQEEQPKDEQELIQKKAHSKNVLNMLHARIKNCDKRLNGYEHEDKKGNIIKNPDGTTIHIEGYHELLKPILIKSAHYNMQVNALELYIGALNDEKDKYKKDITEEQEHLTKLNIIKIGKQVPIKQNDKNEH